MSALRLAFYLAFQHPEEGSFPVAAFILGLRYDLKMVSVLLVVLLLAGLFPRTDPFQGTTGRRLAFWIIGTASVFLVFFYVIDFAHYSYLSQRLSASVLNYLQDAGIALNMVWQTYPVVRLLLGVFIGAFLLYQAVSFVFRRIRARSEKKSRRRPAWMTGAFLVLGLAIFGNIGQFPLRWSDAFSLGSDYKANLALNPFQSFFSSLKFRRSVYDVAKVEQAYPLLKQWYGLPAGNVFPDYSRKIVARAKTAPPNIVIVICESFSAYKSSMYGNPLNTTPYFAAMCRDGLFFDRCFTPSYGTARGVWAVLTGIPDVSEADVTTSRNPAAVDQHSIMDDFSGYEKYYFLGGSASWANIRGLLTDNVNNLHLYEQQDYASPKIDVWGISDKNLFLEADKVFARQRKPFVAIIQTADNHRPYTIAPDDREAFALRQTSADSLRRFGFESNDEMNAFRYTDFGYRKFMEAARRSPYFAHTIFVFVGDHGIAGNAGELFPRAWTEERLDNMHVPLLFYAPGLIAPRRVHEFVSQLDVFPTSAGLAGISYTNTTLGRDLLDSTEIAAKNFAFIYDPDKQFTGVLRGSWLYRQQMGTGQGMMYPVTGDDPGRPVADSAGLMQSLTRGIYETARYMILKNKKKP